MELPLQPARFSKLLFEPVPETVPEVFPEQCSFYLLFLPDILSDREFLVDSGASTSLFSGPKSDSSDRVCLLTADGSPMVCSNTKIILLQLYLDIPVSTSVWSPPECRFLEHFNLLVDIKGRKVVHAQCPESVILHASPTPQPAFISASFLPAPPQIQKFLSEFSDMLSRDSFTAFKPHYSRSSGLCSILLPWPREALHCQRGVLLHGEGWYHQEILVSLVISSPHG